MTDREKAIVMAYTGKCMLTGDKLRIFHKYVEDIMGRPVWTHEMGIGSIADEIKEKSKGDFIALCADESRSENPNKWIPCSERLPKVGSEVLVCYDCKGKRSVYIANFYGDGEFNGYDDEYLTSEGRKYRKAVAWMPLPTPPKMSEIPTSCSTCILDNTDACTRGAGRAVDDEACEDYLASPTGAEWSEE